MRPISVASDAVPRYERGLLIGVLQIRRMVVADCMVGLVQALKQTLDEQFKRGHGLSYRKHQRPKQRPSLVRWKKGGCKISVLYLPIDHMN